ncbi:MAG: hypothetical protein V9F04_04925 [Dermatophilaceae bacterium]
MTADGKERFQDDGGQRRGRHRGRTRSSTFTSRSSHARPAEVRLRILEGRRSRLEERLANIRDGLGPQPRAHGHAIPRRSNGTARTPTEREVRWLEELITAERKIRD